MKSDAVQLAILQLVYDALKNNDWSGKKASLELGMCDKTLRTYRKKLVELGWPVQQWDRTGKKKNPSKKYRARV
jgi:hypothetical protein